MNDLREAARQALEALDEFMTDYQSEDGMNSMKHYAKKYHTAITALRAALEQPPYHTHANGVRVDPVTGNVGIGTPEHNGGKTGWPPELLQDDHSGLSRWLASKPDARQKVRESLEQPAQDEPVAWAESEEDGEIAWRKELCFSDDPDWLDNPMPLYTRPQAREPLTDEQILRLVPGLQDCLCDPYDYNNSGDYYASIPKDMIRLARAIEAAHGIGEKK